MHLNVLPYSSFEILKMFGMMIGKSRLFFLPGEVSGIGPMFGVFTDTFGATYTVYIYRISQLIQPNQHYSNRDVLLLFNKLFHRLEIQMCL